MKVICDVLGTKARAIFSFSLRTAQTTLYFLGNALSHSPQLSPVQISSVFLSQSCLPSSSLPFLLPLSFLLLALQSPEVQFLPPSENLCVLLWTQQLCTFLVLRVPGLVTMLKWGFTRAEYRGTIPFLALLPPLC